MLEASTFRRDAPDRSKAAIASSPTVKEPLGSHKARQDAQDEANVARAERDAFVANCRSLLEEAAAREAVDAVRRAIKGEDPVSLKDALVAIGVGDGR